MSGSLREMSPSLLRQRRNLIATSLALIFLEVAGAKFTKLSLLGTEIQLDRPGAVVATVWVLWSYSLLRYMQYLRAEGDLGILSAMGDRVLYKVRLRFGIEKPFEQDKTGQASFYIVSYVGKARWALIAETYDPNMGGVKAQEAWTFGPWYWARWQLEAFLRVCLLTTKGTDFLLPIALAIAALGAGVWDFAKGSH